MFSAITLRSAGLLGKPAQSMQVSRREEMRETGISSCLRALRIFVVIVTSIRIPAAVVSDMLSHAREESPRECCGLLVGNGDAVAGSVRARNLDAKATRYLIDPEDHFAAIRAARAQGLEVIGAYHSHPSSAPVPSPTDIAEANSGSDFLYVIVSLVDEDVRAYRIDTGVYKALALSPQP